MSNSMRALSLFILLFSLDSLSITNGKEVQVSSPLSSTVFVKNRERNICAGVVIHKKAILTAAHCIYSSTYASNTVTDYYKNLILLSGFNPSSGHHWSWK